GVEWCALRIWVAAARAAMALGWAADDPATRRRLERSKDAAAIGELLAPVGRKRAMRGSCHHVFRNADARAEKTENVVIAAQLGSGRTRRYHYASSVYGGQRVQVWF